MSRPSSLSDRQADFTRRLILEAAVDLVENSIEIGAHGVAHVEDLTLRAVARRANISERTVFRYFSTRQDFFDALVVELRGLYALPPLPATIEELAAMPRGLYTIFEAKKKLVLGGLHIPELFQRMRSTQTAARLTVIRKIVDDWAPKRSVQERRIAAANITFHLGATSWQFFRFSYGFTLEESIAAAETAIAQFLGGLRQRA
jgi:AcrR family transcriptional regulator